jgi:tRNA threonylcarbamoyladenosine biosynthesis protein TsaB
MDPRLLLLETSGRAGWVALAQGDRMLHVRRLDEARRHARDLAPAVAELLEREQWKPRELHAVLVSHGPGSYTGLRVGIMSAKVFAYATGCALLAVDTFAAIALQAPADPPAVVDVLADAQQEKLYVQRFKRTSSHGLPESATALAIHSVADWLAHHEPRRWVTGPGVLILRGRLPEGSRAVSAEDWDPKPESLLRVGLERFRRGERDDVFALEPRYLRPSSAEEKWASKEPRP